MRLRLQFADSPPAVAHFGATCPCPPCDPPVPPGFQMLLVCFSRPEMTSPSTGCPGPLPGPLGGSSLVPSLPPSGFLGLCLHLPGPELVHWGGGVAPACLQTGRERASSVQGRASRGSVPSPEGWQPFPGHLGMFVTEWKIPVSAWCQEPAPSCNTPEAAA